MKGNLRDKSKIIASYFKNELNNKRENEFICLIK